MCAEIDFGVNPSSETMISAYQKTMLIRNDYLELLNNSDYVEGNLVSVGDFFENTFNCIEEKYGFGHGICRIFLHELFLYTVAFLLKEKRYSDVGYILGRTYFSNKKVIEPYYGESYDMFYSSSYRVDFDRAVRECNKKEYYSGTAAYWIANLALDFCSKRELVNADLMCFNYAIYGKEYMQSIGLWFPLLYIYDDHYNSGMKLFSQKLTSREQADGIIKAFNYSSVDDFKRKFDEVQQDISDGKYSAYRYKSGFESAPIMGHYINSKDIGKNR